MNNKIKELYDLPANKRVQINIDTTEKQFLYDISNTLLQIEKALFDINMKIEKVNNMNMIQPMESKEIEVEKNDFPVSEKVEKVDLPVNKKKAKKGENKNE